MKKTYGGSKLSHLRTAVNRLVVFALKSVSEHPNYSSSELLRVMIIILPQGMVDNNLGPDRLAGPKALDPNYCRQPTL